MLEITLDILLWILYNSVMAHIRSHNSLFIKDLGDRKLTTYIPAHPPKKHRDLEPTALCMI